VHLVLLIMVLLMRHGEIPEKPQDPEPLVFVEPAPPPPPAAAGDAGGTAGVVLERAVVAPKAVEPERLLAVAEKATPKATKAAKPRPTPSPQPAQAQAGPTSGDVEPTAARQREPQGKVAGGVIEGVVGGVSGGVVGGVVGGQGDEVLGAAVVAQPPVIVARAVPVYPAEARAQRLEGQVLLQVVIDREGRVEDSVVVLHSAPPFDDAAIAALRQWRFTPGRDHNNRTVRVRIEIPMRFQLR